jgi:outer membrane lipoprotein SlyB
MNRLSLIAVATAATFLTAGCNTAQYRPVVDTQGVNMAMYERDLAQCQQYAHQIDVGNSAAANAAGGAGIMAALAVVLGGNRYDVGRWAGAGAVVGSVNGAAAGGQTQVDIIRNCMSGRGYKVLALKRATGPEQG